MGLSCVTCWACCVSSVPQKRSRFKIKRIALRMSSNGKKKNACWRTEHFYILWAGRGISPISMKLPLNMHYIYHLYITHEFLFVFLCILVRKYTIIIVYFSKIYFHMYFNSIFQKCAIAKIACVISVNNMIWSVRLTISIT